MCAVIRFIYRLSVRGNGCGWARNPIYFVSGLLGYNCTRALRVRHLRTRISSSFVLSHSKRLNPPPKSHKDPFLSLEGDHLVSPAGRIESVLDAPRCDT